MLLAPESFGTPPTKAPLAFCGYFKPDFGLAFLYLKPLQDMTSKNGLNSPDTL